MGGSLPIVEELARTVDVAVVSVVVASSMEGSIHYWVNLSVNLE